MRNKYIYYLVLSSFIFIFVYSTIKLNANHNALDERIKINKEYSNIEKRYYNSMSSLDYYRNYYSNNDIKGILKIDSLNISSLIMQSNDNDYYLTHLENKDENIYGSIMLDYRTNLDKDKINIIYGHSSDYDTTPFTKLERYLEYDFYKTNPYLEIITDNNTYKYEIFSIINIKKNNSKYLNINFNSEQEYLDYLNWLKRLSIFDSNIVLSSANQILIMQTCSSNKNDEFLLLISRKVSD